MKLPDEYSITITTLKINADYLTKEIFRQFPDADPLTPSGRLRNAVWMGNVVMDGKKYAFGVMRGKGVRSNICEHDLTGKAIIELQGALRKVEILKDAAKRHAALKVEYDAWMQRKAETIARCPIPDTKEDGGSRMSWLSLRYEAPPDAPTQAPPPTDQEISLAERNVRREYENMAWAENAEKSYQKLKGLQQFFFVSNRESKTRAT